MDCKETQKGGSRETPTQISDLPPDLLGMIFINLPLRKICELRRVCKQFHKATTSPGFYDLFSSLHAFLVLRPQLDHFYKPYYRTSVRLHTLDISHSWLHGILLSCLPFKVVSPVASAAGKVYLWCLSREGVLELVACNPFTKAYRSLFVHNLDPSKAVLVNDETIVVLNKTRVTVYRIGTKDQLTRFPNLDGLPNKRRTPVLVAGRVYCLSEVSTGWRRGHFRMFCWQVPLMPEEPSVWIEVTGPGWGNVFDVMEKPRLIRGYGNTIFLVGRFKSFTMRAAHSISIWSLDVTLMLWSKVAEMPGYLYEGHFSKDPFKVCGGWGKVYILSAMAKAIACCNCQPDRAPVWSRVAWDPSRHLMMKRGFVFIPRLDAEP